MFVKAKVLVAVLFAVILSLAFLPQAEARPHIPRKAAQGAKHLGGKLLHGAGNVLKKATHPFGGKGVPGALESKVRAMHDEFQAAIARIESATTAVGARLDKLAAKIGSGVTAEEAAPLVAELTALGDKLEAMAKDPANVDPVPLPS